MNALISMLYRNLGPQKSLFATDIRDYSFTYITPNGQTKTLVIENMTSQAEADMRAKMKMKDLVAHGEAQKNSLNRSL